MVRRALCIALCVLAAAPARAIDLRPLAFDARLVGEPSSGSPLEVWRPMGVGPFPAMVVLHGCGGVGAGSRGWAARLAGWGYLAAIVDSLRPRKLADICESGWLLTAELRAQDAFGAATYLRTRPEIDGGRIGVIGFSHGGASAIAAALAQPGQSSPPRQPFRAAVAYYPHCPTSMATRFATDLLIVAGEADDWNPVDRCRYFVQANAEEDHAPAIEVYRGAMHAFDVPGLDQLSASGRRMRENPEAAAASSELTRHFLAQHLVAR
jgi:dienelactone hydrolase